MVFRVFIDKIILLKKILCVLINNYKKEHSINLINETADIQGFHNYFIDELERIREIKITHVYDHITCLYTYYENYLFNKTNVIFFKTE